MRFRGVACGQFLIPLHAQGAGRVPPVKSPYMSGAGQRDPQHFHRACTGPVPLCTRDPHAYARNAGQQPGCRAGSQQQITAPWLCVTCPARQTRGPGAEEIAQEAGHRWSSPRYRTGGPCIPACLPVTSSWPGTGCAPPMRSNAPAGHCPACITATASWNVTRRPPSTTGFGSHPAASPVLGRSPGSSPLAFRRLRRAVPVPARAFRPGGIRQGPSMYEMEGPCPASPHRLVSRLALPAPRAARRPPGPGTRARDRSPGSSHAPGVAPRWYPFPAVKHFYCLRGRHARACGQPFLVPPLSTKQSTGSGQLSAFHGGYPRYYSQPILSLGTASRRTPGLLPPDVIGGPVHIGCRVITGATGFDAGADGLAVADDPARRPSRSLMNHSRRPRPEHAGSAGCRPGTPGWPTTGAGSAEPVGRARRP